MERKIAMSNTTNEQDRKEFSFEENFIDETIIADKSSKTKEFIKKIHEKKNRSRRFYRNCFPGISGHLRPVPGSPMIRTLTTIPTCWQAPAPPIFGTDHYGRDILSRLLAGTRLTLGVSLSSVVVGAALGTVLGLLAGYYGGIIESLVMRASDVLFSFPDILLAIAIVALLGPGIINVFIAVMVFTVPSFARIMRSATLAVKGSLYVEVAQSLGCKDSRLLFVHIFPGTIQSLIVNFTMRIGSAIMAASSLSFLGFGANVTDPEWGAMLSQSRSYLNVAPHMVYFPGLVIFVTVLAFNLFGDGLRDTLDPKIK